MNDHEMNKQRKLPRTEEEARKLWLAYCASGMKPANIPARPDLVYKDQWRGWVDWLGSVSEQRVVLDSRLHVAIESPRDLPGGHMVCADKTMYLFEAAGFVDDTYYWKIADAKAMLTTLKRLVGTATITQPHPTVLSEQEVHDLIRDLEHALRQKQQ